MFFKKADEPIKKIKRIERSDTPTLINWMDATIMGLGKSFDDWRFKDLPESEVTQHVDILKSLWAEISDRMTEK